MIAALAGAALAAMVATVSGADAGAGEDAAELEACRALLARTRAAMEARPPLKEELATGLMWIRMDADRALAADDAATCLREARRAAALLQVE